MTAMAIPTAVVPLADVFALRWEVLRPGLPRESAVFPEDADPGAFHVAAYGPGPAGTEVLGCASFYPEPFPGPDGPPGTAYRIRGMASAASARGLGYGTAVLVAGTAEAAARGAKALWCNGRTEARAFYERHGYRVYGEEFVIEGVGPHYVLARELSD